MLKCDVSLQVSLTSLLLDLVARPSSSVLGPLRKVLVRASLASHGCEPLVLKVVADLTTLERLGDITWAQVSIAVYTRCLVPDLPDDTHAGPQQSLGPVGILVDAVE